MAADIIKAEVKALKKLDRELRYRRKRRLMLGRGYRPRLKDPNAVVLNKSSPQWYRIRANPQLR